MYIYHTYTTTAMKHTTSLVSRTKIAAAVPSRIRTLTMNIYKHIYIYIYVYAHVYATHTSQPR